MYDADLGYDPYDNPPFDEGAFQYCCGTDEIGNFDNLAKPEEIVKAIQDNIKQGRKGRMIFCTTASNTGADNVRKALKKLKFKHLKPFKNGNSGNMVTVWYKLV